MSFFGFDPSGPPHVNHPAQQESYDFQETYEGLGEIDDADDALNDETFGVASVGKDFNFGSSAPAPAPSTIRPELSFARAAAANDDDFMKDLWGDSTPEPKNQPPAPTSSAATGQDSAGARKILSLEEIEAQLTAIDPSQQQHQQQQQRGVPQAPPMQQQFYPGMPPQYGGYMMPQGYMMPPPQYGMPFPGQFMPHPMGQQMPGMPGMHQPPHMYAQGVQGQTIAGPSAQAGTEQQQQQLQHNQPQVPQQQQQQQQQPQNYASVVSVQATSVPSNASPSVNASSGNATSTVVSSSNTGSTVVKVQTKPADMSQFPVLGAPQAQVQSPSVSASSGTNFQDQPRFHERQHMEELLPEEQQKLAKRQEKVSRIMRYCGVMNPKDKDFVTRFQLSQIVTDDPYNEDFYAQVYRVIHPKSAADGSVMAVSQPNSIAQAYLDQSGHRLGGRFKRADVALHRMQQQVQKAVTVAKERQKLPQHVREGVLGKVSVGSGKKPRQQLVILSKAAQKAKDIEESEDAEIPVQVKTARSSSIAAPSKPIKKYTKKDIMSILEEIISNLMNVESESRLTNDVDTSKMWESLHVLDQNSSSGDDESFVNPFIQALNYPKALKILPRLFKFLTREQILTVITLIMANLENLKVIKDGSYTTYADKKVPEEITKLVEVYTLTFCKVLMNAVQDFKFTEIVGLLYILIQHNVLSFVSTTKIGLSVVTSLLSRAELMTGEGHISATDLSAWTSCYDELFTALESRIAAIFSPNQADTEDDYVWQFLATLSLGGKLSHQRIIVDEVRDEIFGVMNRAKALDCTNAANLYKKQNMLNNLNMYLVVMGLVADENEIQELKS